MSASAPASDREESPDADRRRYWRAGALGGLPAFVVFVLILLHGNVTLLRSEPLSGFYDLQAHSLVHLRWDVPAGLMGIEGFRIGSKTYEYFGPWPALLRLPIAAVTHRFDGELTQLSMMLAFVIALIATTRLAWRIRVTTRGDAPVNRVEQLSVGAFIFLVGAGSGLLFFSSRLLVFHEAGIWGVALALAAFEWVLAYVSSQRTVHLVAACGLTTLAVLSRVSVGMGPLLALGLVLLAGLGATTRRLAGLPDSWNLRRNLPRIAAALLIPLILYTGVNYAKFGSLVGVPFDRQVIALVDTQHQAVLRANNNSMFGLQFVPTVVTQLVRPDAIRLSPLFPWVTFPPHANIFGDVVFDHIEPMPSIPASMPAITALFLLGLVGIFRRRNGRVSAPTLRTPLIGAAFALIPSLAFGFIAQRYLADALPLLVLGALVGMQMLLGWNARRTRSTPVRVVWCGLVVLVLLSVWFNAGLAVLYQRAWGYKVPRGDIVSFVDLQYSLHHRFPGGSPPHLAQGAKLPFQPPPAGDLFEVGDCAGLYWSNDGVYWEPLERTNATGLFRLRADLSALPTGVRVPLVSYGQPGSGIVVTLRKLPSGRVQAELFTDGAHRHHVRGKSFAVPNGTTKFSVVLDHQAYGNISVVANGEEVLTVLPPKQLDVLDEVHPFDQAAIGRNTTGIPTAQAFPGTLTSLPIQPRLCRKITGTKG